MTVTLSLVYDAHMSDAERSLNIEELSERSDTPVRTIRFYITEGLLPRPVARGKGASYGEEHLSRLRLIRRLTDQRVPLAEIRERLATLSLAEISAILRTEERLSAELRRAEQAPSAKAYVSALLNRSRHARLPSAPIRASPNASARAPMRAEAEPLLSGPEPPALAESAPYNEADLTWRRVELAPGVELHVRADAEERSRRLIERLIELARRTG
jgi:DNA-binding transcriptional MerR regulator